MSTIQNNIEELLKRNQILQNAAERGVEVNVPGAAAYAKAAELYGGKQTTASSASANQNSASTSTVPKLNTSQTAAPVQTSSYAKRLKELGGGDYAASENVLAAQQYLQNIVNNKPADYQSKYGAQLDALYQQIMNRDKFSYDMNADALYQQYKDAYQLQGQQAMQDAMGQAAAMTGGYGSSYASTVGQQAYQGYLQKLNEIVPQLRQQAFDIYQQEGQDLQNRYAITQSAEQMDYGRWQDEYGRWQDERGFAQSAYENERSFDYNDYTNRLNTAMSMLDYEYQDSARQQDYAQQAKMLASQQAHDLAVLAKQQAYQDAVREAEYARQDALRAEDIAREDALRAEEYARQDALLKQGYEREDALRAEDNTRQDQLIQQGYDREDALRAEDNARQDALIQSGYDREDQLRAEDNARQDQLIQDSNAREDALRQEGYDRQDQLLANEYAREDISNAQNQAYTYAMAMITKGALPSDDMLAAAGISKADAKELAKKYGYYEKSSSSSSKNNSSSGSTTTTTTTTTPTYVTTYEEWLKKATGG